MDSMETQVLCQIVQINRVGGGGVLGLSECCKDLCATRLETLSTFQDFTKTFNRCLPDDNVSKFYSVFLTILLKILLFQWSVVEKKMGPKKVGHIYKFISCTGLAYTGRSLFLNCTGQHYLGS